MWNSINTSATINFCCSSSSVKTYTCRMMNLYSATSLALSTLIFGASISWAVDCGINDRNTKCLDVFSSNPADLPKCYCTNLCEQSLDFLKHNCPSGELHQDGCGACLTCAKALNQTCGGQFNVLGSCAGGLTCLIDIPREISKVSERRKAENSAVGFCVSDRSSECPTASVSASAFSGSKLCRPGRRGIIAEALYCPKQSEQTRCATTKQEEVQHSVQEEVQHSVFPSLFQVISGTAESISGGLG